MHDLKYTLLMVDRMRQEAYNEAYILECLAIAENSNLYEELISIREGVIDKIKVGWEKLKTWIKNLWAKFMEKFNKIALSDADYLKKYQDIIFNKKKVDATYTMLDYPTGIYRCTQVKVPQLNYGSMKDSLDPEDPGKFLKTIIKDYDNKTNVDDFINAYFVGGSRETSEVNVNDLKFADMYDLCVNYTKIHKTLENDKKVIESSFSIAESAIASIKEENPEVPKVDKSEDTTGEEKKKQTTGGDGDTGGDGGTNVNVGTESALERFFGTGKESDYIYSSVLEAWINEEGERVVNDKDSSKSSAAATSTSNLVSNMANSKEKDSVSKSDKADRTKAAVGSGEKEAAAKQIGVYQDVCCKIMSAKLNAVENARTTYMKILRTHIKDHVGAKESESGSNKARTDYSSIWSKQSNDKKTEVNEFLKSAGINTDGDKIIVILSNEKSDINALADLAPTGNAAKKFLGILKSFFIKDTSSASDNVNNMVKQLENKANG